MIKAGLFGLGTVGRGLVEIVRTGNYPVEIAGIVDRSYAKKEHITGNIPASDDPNFLLENKEIDTIVELIGGTEQALYVVRKALEAGKNVVTANKALLAEHGFALFNKARENGVTIAFEAAVAGAIPIIHNLQTIYTNESIFGLYGILNGTSNYILTRMRRDENNYEDVLNEAQTLGLAEADPTLDVNGKDATHKLALLATLVRKKWIDHHQIETRGITDVNLTDVIWAEKMGYRIRLIARMQIEADKTYLSVEPTLISSHHYLWDIELENNAILVDGQFAGASLLVGKGAGSLPTAFSVLTDILTLQKNPQIYRELSEKNWEVLHPDPVHELESAFYLRLQVKDKPNVLARIASILGDNSISIASVHQENLETGFGQAILVIITHTAKGESMRHAFQEIEKTSSITGNSVFLPIAPEA